MSKTVQWKRGNANVSSTYTGPEGELTVNTTNWTLNIHDGVTQGGHPASFSLGNLDVSDQTIFGTVANANIVIDPDGTGIVVLNNGVTTSGNVTASYFVGNGSLLSGIATNYSNVNVAAYLTSYTGNISAGNISAGNISAGNLLITDAFLITANSANNFSTMATVANNDARISATNGALNSTIYLWANNGRMSFNTISNAFDFNFNGQLSATDFTASKSSATGYSFYTPGEGLAGFTHVNGPPSYIRIVHDGIEYTKFYANYTTQTIGNLVISSNANVFGSFPTAFVQVYANVNSYSQIVHQNLNSGNLSSSDFVGTADNGTDSTHYVDLGIASSTYNFPGFEAIKPNDVYLLAVGNNVTGPGSVSRGNLVIGSTTGNINFFVGAPQDANVITQINSTGLVPGGNVTYNLGSATRQWKDLWLSNSTMYLGGVPITVTANGQLSVNGSVISGNVGGDYGNANVAAYLPTYTGNLSVGNIIMAAASAASKIQFKAVGSTNGATIYDDSGSLILSPNTTYSPTAGVGIGGLGYLLAPNGSRNLTLNYGSVNGQVGIQTNLVVGTTLTGGNITVANNIVASGNITGSYFIGNGALLTGIAASSNYGNANVAAYLPTYTGNIAANIVKNGYTWTFDSVGNITIPGSINAEFTTSPAPRLSGFDVINSGLISVNNITILGNLTGNINANISRIINGNSNVTIDSNGGNISFTVSGSNYGHIKVSNYALGYRAGNVNQSVHAVAIGNSAGQFTQGTYGIAIGHFAANSGQSTSAIAIGTSAGQTSQGQYSVAIGTEAGYTGQGADGIAIGDLAGRASQGTLAIAIGTNAGEGGQGQQAIAMGAGAGTTSQGNAAIAIGYFAALTNQRTNAIAIGAQAGGSNQGVNSIAIGASAGAVSQANNSIILNATGVDLNTNFSGFYVDPVRNDVGNISQVVTYNTSTKEFTYANTISLAGNITAGNVSSNVNGFAIGYRDIPQVVFTSNATLALSDAGKHYFSSNSANVITIPNNTTVSFSIGTAISIVQQGTANLTVTPGSGVTLYLAGNSTSASRTLGNFGMATLMKVATNTWFINGTGVN